MNGPTLVEFSKREIRSRVARFDRAGARLRPHGLEWTNEEYFPGQMHHYPGKCLRRTMHDPPHVADKDSPENEHHNEHSRRDFDPATAWFSGNGRYGGVFHT